MPAISEGSQLTTAEKPQRVSFCDLKPRNACCSLLLPILEQLWENDLFLLTHQNAGERSITHKMGMYAEQTVKHNPNFLCFPEGVDVDCEFPYTPVAKSVSLKRKDVVGRLKDKVRHYLSEMAKILKDNKDDRDVISLLLIFAMHHEVQEVLQAQEAQAQEEQADKRFQKFQQLRGLFRELIQQLTSSDAPDETRSHDKEREDEEREGLLKIAEKRKKLLEIASDFWNELKTITSDYNQEAQRQLKVIDVVSPENLRRLGERLEEIEIISELSDEIKDARNIKGKIKRCHICVDEKGITLLLPALDSVLENEGLTNNQNLRGAKKTMSASTSRKKGVVHSMYPDIVLHNRNALKKKRDSLYCAIEVKKMPPKIANGLARNANTGKIIAFLSEYLYDILKIQILHNEFGSCDKFGGAFVILRTQQKGNYPHPCGATQIATAPSYPVACLDYPSRPTLL